MMERRAGDLKGPKSLEAWIEVFKRRAGDDEPFALKDNEHLYYHPEHGFFTWLVCERPGRISIPKMCGNGRVLRRMVYEFVRAAEHLGIREVLFAPSAGGLYEAGAGRQAGPRGVHEESEYGPRGADVFLCHHG